MAHDHTFELKNYNNAFFIGIALNILFVIAEVIYGITAGSLALISDAGHNLSDVMSLVASWIAVYLGRKKPTKKFTYGLKKTTVLAALFNAIILLIAIGGIMWEAIRRVIHPVNVNGKTVIIVALIGVIINGITALFFFSGRKHDLNIKSAFLHMAADCLMSLGVVVSGIIILFTNFKIIDPIVSLIIASIILYNAWDLLKESIFMAIDSVPKNIDVHEVIEYFRSIPGIKNVHDIHIWNMSTSEIALTAHVVKPENSDDDKIIKKILKDLKEKFKITHATIQFEREHNMCEYKDKCMLN